MRCLFAEISLAPIAGGFAAKSTEACAHVWRGTSQLHIRQICDERMAQFDLSGVLLLVKSFDHPLAGIMRVQTHEITRVQTQIKSSMRTHILKYISLFLCQVGVCLQNGFYDRSGCACRMAADTSA